MGYDLTGILHKVFDTESKTDSFKSRDIVIRTEEQYPQYIKFQLVQDRCDLVDTYREGQVIRVSFDLRGKEWQGKYFTNLNCWKIEKISSGSMGEAKKAEPAQTDDWPNDPF